MRRSTLGLATVVIAGCAPARVFTFHCPDGTQLYARYQADSVHLRLPDGTATLPLTRSGSGARYANDTLVFWEHAGTARLERRGRVLHEGCRPTAGPDEPVSGR